MLCLHGKDIMLCLLLLGFLFNFIDLVFSTFYFTNTTSLDYSIYCFFFFMLNMMDLVNWRKYNASIH